MSKRRFCSGLSAMLVLIGLIVAAAILFSKSPAPLADSPRLVIPGCGGDLQTGIATGMSLGAGRPGDILRGSFEIRNGGATPLTFELKTGCQCAELVPPKGVVNQGDSQRVDVAVRLRKKGQEERFSIWISSNDPDLQLATYPVTAQCPRGFSARPARVHFGNVRRGTLSRQWVTITAHDPDLDLLALKESVFGPHLTVKRSTLDQAATLEIELAASAPPGDFFGMISVSAPDGEEQTIPVSGKVCQLLIASPSSFFLPRPTPGNQWSQYTCLVRRFDSKPLGPMAKAEAPTWLEASDSSTGEVVSRLIRFRVLGTVPVASKESSNRVRVFFPGVDEPLDVLFVSLPDTFSQEETNQ